MKRFLYFLFVLSALLTAACSDEQVEVPSMRFERRIYSLTSSPVEVKLFVAQKSAEAKVLPVVFEGTAVRGQTTKCRPTSLSWVATAKCSLSPSRRCVA